MTRDESRQVHIAQRIDSAAVHELAEHYEVSVGYGDHNVELSEVIDRVDALVVRNMTLDNALVDRACRLRLIVRAGSGLDGIDVEYIRGRGIEVVSTGGSNSRSVAEHVVSLVLAVAKSIVGWDRLARDGGYARRDEDPAQELYQKRWGIVGFGKIGQAVAQIARDGFGMEVAAFVRQSPPEPVRGVELFFDLDVLLASCDVVTLHVPLTEQTRGMIGARQIGLMRDSAILVNAARGPVVDAEPLFDALAAGSLRGAAIDVWDGPFPESPHRLYETPHLVLSPHRAGRTLEADQAAGALVVKHVRNALG